MTDMPKDIADTIRTRIKLDYKLRETQGDWWREGKCPDCGEKSLFVRADNPWVLKCGRLNGCGHDHHVKDLYRDLFDDWSKRYPRTDNLPNAAADQYLSQARGLDLARLKGCYREETFFDQAKNIGTATVRFTVHNDVWWERFIDRAERFGDQKANFRGSYRGECWLHPEWPVEKLARTDAIWFPEGIFDACALVENNIAAASPLSTNNYPDAFLSRLKKEYNDSGRATAPELIFAFDGGKAGVDFTRKYVERARKEGWKASAAQYQPDGEGDKKDWNDLHQAGRLKPDDIELYLWAGQVTLAADEMEKAWLLWKKPGLERRPKSLWFVHQRRTWWARFTRESIDGTSETVDKCTVSRIANCAFRVLYRERDDVIDETNFYLNVDLPGQFHPERGRFSSSALTSAGEFKKRLMAFGAMWTGGSTQLDKIIEAQTSGMKTVTPLDFVGYSRQHKAWLLGDVAISGGKIIKANKNDYFEIGRHAVKLRTSERNFKPDVKSQSHSFNWFQPYAAAFGARGILTLAFWNMALFAEQIRERTKGLGFWEMCGPMNTGKSTVIVFLWKLCGRVDASTNEGFDPSKATTAALYRNFAGIANFPVVLMEGDRTANEKRVHVKSFDFDELKPLWTGGGLRERGVRNAGNETYSPPFRAAILIEQNEPVNGSPALLSRIMQTWWTRDHFTDETAKAATTIENWDEEKLSSYLPHVLCREKELLDYFVERFNHHLPIIKAIPGVTLERIAKNHAQLAAALDMTAKIVPMREADHSLALDEIRAMAVERQRQTQSEHPIVVRFWELFNELERREDNNTIFYINMSAKAETGLIAVNLPSFEAKCHKFGLRPPTDEELKKHLKTSRNPRFIKQTSVTPRVRKSATDDPTVKPGSAHCWIFQRETSAPTKANLI